MLNRIKKLNNEGFTIIEVMIVLAIAGLILLIVLLAVPALQRNARNTTIKNDASALAAGISEYESNNNGLQPTALSGASPSITVGANGTSQATVKTSGGTTVTIAKGVPTSVVYSTLFWNTGTTCPSSGATANPRSVTVMYYVEQSTAPVLGAYQCVDAA